MSQILVLLLLTCALVVPLVGAVALRLAEPRLGDGRLTIAAALVFVLAAASVLVLARSDVSRIQVAGLTVLLPVSAPVDGDLGLPPGLDAITPAPDPTEPAAPTPGAAATQAPATAMPAATAPPTATQAATAPATATPEPPTATPEPPTATPEPPTATPEPPTATPEAAQPRRYTVQSGDTLRTIAEQFNVTVAAILQANNLTPEQADSLRPGQELIIP